MAPVTIQSNARGWYEGSTTVFWTGRVLWWTGTSLYAVVQDSGGSPKIRILKADNPYAPSSWTEQDAGNNKAINDVNASWDSFFDGTYIHVVYFTGATTLTHHRFAVATDLWTTGYGAVNTAVAGNRPVRVAGRTTDGTVRVAFADSADDADLWYGVSTGGAWNRVALVSASDTDGSVVYDVCLDGTNRMQISWYAAGSDDIRWVSYDGTTAGTFTDITTGGPATSASGIGGARFNMYDDAGTDKVILAYLSSTGSMSERTLTLEAASASARAAAAVTVEAVAGGNIGTRTPISTAVVGGVPYAFWWDDASSGSIVYKTKSGGAWGSFTTFATGITKLIEVVPVASDGLAVVYQSGSDVVFDWFLTPVAPPVTVNADRATGTALASTPTVREFVQGVLATGSALASAPSPAVQVPGVVATASGLHLVPTIRELVQGVVALGSAAAIAPGMRESVAVPLSTTSALFRDVTVLVGPVSVSADRMLATAAMLAPTIRAAIAGVVATGSAQALAPGVRLSVPVPAATGSAVALDPTFAPMLIAGALATASGLMSNPTPRLSVAGVVAAVLGLLSAPTVRTRVNVPLVAATALMRDPGVLVGPVSVAVDLALVSGLAYAPGVRSAVPVTVASGVATMLVPAIGFRVSVPASGVGAEALPPTFLLGPVVIAVDLATAGGIGTTPVVRESVAVPVATSTGSATAPVPRLLVLSPLMPVAGEAFDATTEQGALLISVTLATAAALGIPPAIAIRVLAPVIAAAAAAVNPSLRTTVASPSTNATAALLVPAVRTSLLVPAATGSAQATAPTMTLRVAVPLGIADAAGITPTLRTIALGERMEAAGLLVPPGPRIVVQGATAAADGLFWDPEVVVEDDSVFVDVDLAIGTAASGAPQLLTRVPSVTATGSAGGLAPQPVIRLAAPLSHASLLAYEPRILATVFSPTGQAGASFEIPSVASLVGVPLAIAGGAMFEPLGRVLVTVPRMDAAGVAYDVFVAADILSEVLPGGQRPHEVLFGGRVIVAVAPGGHTATVLSGGKPPARILAGGKGTDE